MRGRAAGPLCRFAGAGRALGRKARTLADMGESQFTAETFLGRLPKTVVKNGRILDLRDDVYCEAALFTTTNKRMGGESPVCFLYTRERI